MAKQKQMLWPCCIPCTCKFCFGFPSSFSYGPKL